MKTDKGQIQRIRKMVVFNLPAANNFTSELSKQKLINLKE